MASWFGQIKPKARYTYKKALFVSSIKVNESGEQLHLSKKVDSPLTQSRQITPVLKVEDQRTVRTRTLGLHREEKEGIVQQGTLRATMGE